MLFPYPVGSTARTSRFSINSRRKHSLCSSFNFRISGNKLRAFSSDDSKSLITERFAIVSSQYIQLERSKPFSREIKKFHAPNHENMAGKSGNNFVRVTRAASYLLGSNGLILCGVQAVLLQFLSIRR